MPRPATGQVLTREGRDGTLYSLRFTAYGERRRLPLGSSAEGWHHAKAQAELDNILADVRRGVWRPGIKPDTPSPPTEEPDFHTFASRWFEARKDELAERTQVDYRWRLSSHLLPYFADHRLSEITVEQVDAYRAFKVREAKEIREARERGEDVGRPLSASSINKTLILLGAILEVAVEYGHVAANPARGRRRRLKASAPARTYLQPEQVQALLAAAKAIDTERAAVEPTDTGWRQPLVAVLCKAGPRIGETLGLRWGQVDLLGRRLDVLDAKTDAGKRTVELTPGLAELLQDYKLRARHTDPDDFVFCTRTGKRQNPSNVRNRLLASEAPKGYSATAVERANEMLLREGGQPLPKITPHSLRRTAISLMLAAGNDPRWVMAQVGHTDPSMTLRVYAQVIQSKQERGGLVDELVAEKATKGQNAPSVPIGA